MTELIDLKLQQTQHQNCLTPQEEVFYVNYHVNLTDTLIGIIFFPMYKKRTKRLKSLSNLTELIQQLRGEFKPCAN